MNPQPQIPRASVKDHTLRRQREEKVRNPVTNLGRDGGANDLLNVQIAPHRAPPNHRRRAGGEGPPSAAQGPRPAVTGPLVHVHGKTSSLPDSEVHGGGALPADASGIPQAKVGRVSSTQGGILVGY